MLVEFRVTNFRSIRDELCLSMVASKDKEKSGSNTISTGIPAAPSLVRSAVIYGPNASGKSALVNALQFAQSIVATSATLMPGQRLNQTPFKLDPVSNQSPSEFEFTFIMQGIRYQYGFSLLPDRVVEEWLLVYKASKPQVWYERKGSDGESHTFHFGSSLSGTRKLWQAATRPNALFLSTAIQLNSESLRPVYDWITKRLSIMPAGMQPQFDYSTIQVQSPEGKPRLLNFLRAADIGIADLSVELRKQKVVNFEFRDDSPQHTVAERETLFPVFVHKSGKGDASFQVEEESTGTQRLFAFAAPLIDVLRNGRVLVVDELDGSLHSHIVRFLVGLFHQPSDSTESAQLIFTTHDTSLLDAEIFRRDQIWLMEKGRDQQSSLYALTDFSPRKNEALERGYLLGRYGALPLLTDFFPKG